MKASLYQTLKEVNADKILKKCSETLLPSQFTTLSFHYNMFEFNFSSTEPSLLYALPYSLIANSDRNGFAEFNE
jgi:hypothetical protein